MLTVRQKWDAIQALNKAEIKCRDLSDFYIEDSTSIGGDGCLIGKYGNGRTAEEAVENHFEIYTTLDKSKQYIHVSQSPDYTDRYYHWSGWGWKWLSNYEVAKIRSNNGL